MSDTPEDGDLSGKVCRMVVEQQRNGYLLTVWMHIRSQDTMRHGVALFSSGQEYVAADRDELAGLVRRLMAEPPEGRAR